MSSALVRAACALAAAAVIASCGREPARSDGREPDLVIMSSHPADLVKLVVDEFRERSGLVVAVKTGGTGELIERIRSGEDADLLWGGGAETLAANVELFAPYISPERDAVPESLKDAAGYWTGFSVLPMVILVNSRLVAPELRPTSWADLANERYRGSVAFADPARSGSSYTALRTMLLAAKAAGERDGGWAFVERFALGLEGRTLKESAAVYAGVASGEYLVGATYEYAAGDALRLGGDVTIVYPRDGSSALPDGVAIVGRSARRPAAESFVDFALGRDVALAMRIRFLRRSARGDVQPPAGLPALDEIPLLTYDFAAAADERAATLARFKGMLDGAVSP